MNIRFLTGNPHKIQEANQILSELGINVIPYNEKIEEIQTNDTKKLVRDKALKAYEIVGRPLFVEHTGLYIEKINDLPGGLTQIFWDSLQADNFSKLFGKDDNVKVTARTIIGYCDNMKIHFFEGEVKGTISSEPKGSRDFQWDCVFIPEGYSLTFAELGQEKNKISMRKKALDKFANYLRENMK